MHGAGSPERYNQNHPLSKKKVFSCTRAIVTIGLYLSMTMSVAFGVFGSLSSQSQIANDSASIFSPAFAAQDNSTTSLIIPASFGPGSTNGKFQSPVGVAVDKSGNIYVVDSQTAHVQVFDSTGKYLSTVGGFGSGSGQFNYPYGIAIDGSGNIYVQDNLNSRIQKFDPSGKFLMAFGNSGSGSGQFRSLGGVAVDNSGYVYVVDSALDRVQKFDPAGQVKLVFGSWASNKFDPTGAVSGGKFDNPHGIAVDGSGNIYVADTGNDRIQKLDASGRFILLFGRPGSSTGELDSPNGVAVDSGGNVYVLDSGNDRVQKFDSNGKFLSSIGSAGFQQGSGKFFAPSGIAVDASGNVYVADTGNYQVQVISMSGSNVVPEFPVSAALTLVASVGAMAVLGRSRFMRK